MKAQHRLRLAATTGLVLGVSALVPLANAATLTTTTTASADSYVSSNYATANYGTSAALKVRNSPARTTYVRLPVTGTGTLNSASLELYTSAACSIGAKVGVVSASWGETSLTWNNRPSIGPSVGTLPPRASAGWTTLDVTTSTPTTGSVSFGITAAATGSCSFTSREGGAATAPRLVLSRTTVDPSPTATATPVVTVTAAPTPTFAPPNDPVIAATGDIACDPTDQNFNGGAGLGSYCQHAAVASLIAAMNPNAVLALGDQQYEDGTQNKFRSSYALSWSRFDSIVHPVAGNHEYLDPGAAGYYAYFGAAAGDPTKGYYSFDVGQWHIVMLNSECAAVGGCSAGNPQEAWLRADLAAHPTSCTMAVWHRPRFTSGEAQAATTPQGQATFWQDLYAAGADVVLGGHIHNYERFAAIKPDGTADPVSGLRQFVVGTGGKSLVGFNATKWATSEARDSTHYGALQLVLHANSYDWQYLPADGGAAIDAGSQSCH